jgi:hypothetical protein
MYSTPNRSIGYSSKIFTLLVILNIRGRKVVSYNYQDTGYRKTVCIPDQSMTMTLFAIVFYPLIDNTTASKLINLICNTIKMR